MRLAFSLLLCVSMVPLAACDARRRKGDRDKINRDHDVTIDRKAKDPLIADIAKNWRQFITESPELTKPVYVDPKKPPREPWVPVVTPECVFSREAGGRVPQVTLTWNERMRSEVPGVPPPEAKPAAAGGQARADQPVPAETPRLRFDIALHHDGFGRNYYTAILASDKQQRFKIPSNGGLANDAQTVVQTGAVLFPRLVDFRTETFVDPEVRQQFLQHTMVLQELGQGLTYAIRLDTPANDQWNEEKRFAFLTPTCPQGF